MMMLDVSKRAAAICGLVLALSSSAIAADDRNQPDAGSAWQPSHDRARAEGLPLDRLSSGALLRLDDDGNLVEPHAAWADRVERLEAAETQRQKAAIALDRRVGANIRLGDDPPELPADRRAQAEPHIARSHNDPDLLVATSQEGRYETGGGAVKCGYSVSRDGGLTWTRSLIPGNYVRETDPVAAINIDGTILLNTLGGRSTGSSAFADADVVVNRSTDGGRTFTPSVAYRSTNSPVDPDKNWMAVNTFPGSPNPGRVLVTFTNFIQTSQSNFDSPIVRVFSDDGGATWSPPLNVTSVTADCQGSQPVFLRDGRAAIVYWNFGSDAAPSGDDFMQVVVSNNGGTTFGSPKLVTNVTPYFPPNIRSGGFLPSATTDRQTSTLYVTYQANHQGSPRVMFTKSTNGGDNWTTPIPISDNPFGSGVFNPAIAASPDGQRLTVAFYDLRDNPGSTTRVDMYLAQSFDGGSTWQPNIRLTSESSDAALAPNTGSSTNPSYMLGDYIGIAPAINDIVPAVPVWVDTRTGNPDPFVTRVGIAPQVDFISWQAARLSNSQTVNQASGFHSGDADGDGQRNSAEYDAGTEPNESYHTARQLNIATRARVQTGENILIGGFIITGNEPKRVIIRAIGPSLTGAGVPGALQDPVLQLLTDNNVVVAENDDWRETQEAEIVSSGVPPSDDREAAIVQTLAPGNYTAALSGKGGTSGVALVEVYDLAPAADSRLANISTRSFVDTGEDVMIGGLILGAGAGPEGAGSAQIVLRAIGPSLAQQGITGALQDPDLVLFDANGTVLRVTDRWREWYDGTELLWLGLAPTDDREAAMVFTLPRGNYTAIVRGRNGTAGVALVEAYNVQ